MAMAGASGRAPLGSGTTPVDAGTLARTSTPAPAPVGTATTGPAAPSRPAACGPCTGHEITTIAGLGAIASYAGEFPAPLRLMWYAPETNEVLKIHFRPSEIRGWIKAAAAYHGIPHVLLAVILQQENGPRATTTQKTLQFAERTLTTAGAILDEWLWDIVPDAIAGSSSGFANMSRATLRSAARHTEEKYCKNPMPADVRYRLLGWDQDTRIPGDDWKADLYYCAAHLRQLIDRITGTICHSGAISLDQLERVIAAYNGSGPLAAKYAKGAMKLLGDAAAGSATLYFYET
jgi:hypothetical protein